jgi:hypothetical protein
VNFLNKEFDAIPETKLRKSKHKRTNILNASVELNRSPINQREISVE